MDNDLWDGAFNVNAFNQQLNAFNQQQGAYLQQQGLASQVCSTAYTVSAIAANCFDDLCYTVTVGDSGTLGAATANPKAIKPHPDLAWLDQRVNEMRVAL